MIQAKPTLSPETKTYSYFDNTLEIQQTAAPCALQPQKVHFRFPGSFYDQKTIQADLFLSHNPWKVDKYFVETLDYYYRSKPAFVFRNCVVCGETRFDDEYFSNPDWFNWGKIALHCDKSECQERIDDLTHGKNTNANAFIGAIFRKNVPELRRHTVYSKMYYYFDYEMELQEKISYPEMIPQQVEFKIPYMKEVRRDAVYKYLEFSDYTVELFLSHNPWRTYELINSPWCDENKVGFVFRNCLVCGVQRFKDEDFPKMGLHGNVSPIYCRSYQCEKVFHDLLYGNEHANKLYHAILARHPDSLKHRLK